MRVLEPFFNGYDPNYSELRTRCRDILQQEDSLSEIVQLVGRDSLSEDQKVLLVCEHVPASCHRTNVFNCFHRSLLLFVFCCVFVVVGMKIMVGPGC